MKRKALSMIIVLLTVCSTVFAGERRIYVGGKKIDIHKSGRIYTDAIKSGTVTFDAEEDADGFRRLILDNAVIETTGKDKRGINSSITNLKIVVNGTCRITTANAQGIKIDGEGGTKLESPFIRITGSGTLYVNATGGSAVYMTSCSVNEQHGLSGYSGWRSAALSIKDDVTVHLNSTTDCGIKGNGDYCYAYVQDNAILISEGKKHAVEGLKYKFDDDGLVIKSGYVSLIGNGNYSTIEGTKVSLDKSMEFDNPDLWYSSDKQTVFEGNSTTAYKGDIEIRRGLAITETTFPDKNFRDYVLGLNAGKDGYLVRSEIANITSMDVHSKGIKDLTGIRHFTALKSLVCFLNDLTSLDVSVNTNLEYLDCTANNLTSLVVSRTINPNTNLKEVRCYCNQLDASATGSMVYGLPSVSNGKLLIHADNGDDGNVITPAKVTEAKNKGWTVQKQNSSNQEVAYTGSTGVVINETNFPDENFRTYLRSQDYGKDDFLTTAELQAVTKLNVSEKGISNLKGIEHFTALKKLWCWSNSLTSLSVSKNTKLTVLSISGNKIKGTNMTTLVNSLPSNSGEFYVCNEKYSTDNEITSAQVATAKNKGWKVLRCPLNSGYVNYDGNIDINEENFPDVFFRNYLMKQSYGSDGSLSPAELKTVTEMDVSSNGIDDLKGVEFFTALTKLQCQENCLTSLDVSKNTELTYLNCRDNNLGQNGLNVTKNTKLTYLNCRNNGLSSLNLTYNTALEELRVTENSSLGSLDVSKNTKLTYLGCGNCNLTTLDVSKNTALEKLYCYDNGLTSLNVSKNTKLKLLSCYQNNIGVVNMSSLVSSLPSNSGTLYICNTAADDEGNVITPAQVQVAKSKGWKVKDYPNTDYAGDAGIEINATNFPDAKFRAIVAASDIDKNQDSHLTKDELEAVTALNLYDVNPSIATLKGIEYFTELTALECGKYTLTSLDVSKNTKLTSLWMQQTSITSLDLSNNTALTTLNCSNNDLASLDVSNCKALTTLDCSGNNIRGDQMTILVNSLPETNGTLYVRDTRFPSSSDNEISPSQVMVARNKGWAVKRFFSTSWEDYYGVPDVEINETNFPDEIFRAVVAGPDINTNGDEGLSYEELQAVTRLDVSGMGIATLTGIEHFTALKELYCAYNNLTNLSFTDLGALTELTTLDCSYNQLTALGIFDKNTKLEKLYCSNNNMKTLSLRRCPLTYLDCSNNKLYELSFQYMGGALTHFYCDANELTTLDVTNYKALTVLDCSGNKINGDNMSTLVNSLPNVDHGEFVVCNEDYSPDNAITAAQVADATDKGWTVTSACSGDYKEGYAGQGDVNGDGKINQDDLDLIVKIVMGQRPEDVGEFAGDLNNDGKTDAADVVVMVGILKSYGDPGGVVDDGGNDNDL